MTWQYVLRQAGGLSCSQVGTPIRFLGARGFSDHCTWNCLAGVFNLHNLISHVSMLLKRADLIKVATGKQTCPPSSCQRRCAMHHVLACSVGVCMGKQELLHGGMAVLHGSLCDNTAICLAVQAPRLRVTDRYLFNCIYMSHCRREVSLPQQRVQPSFGCLPTGRLSCIAAPVSRP